MVLAVLPFQLPLLQHLWNSGPAATGFLGYDTPYYVANGRAVFERGNGLASPNPYDPDPAAPAIYFHAVNWVLGFGVKVLGFDPGAFFAVTGVLASLLGGAFTLRLVEAVLPDPRGRLPLFILTMWGGGALCLAALIASLAQGQGLPADWFDFDRPNGWWFPNWGRNFILAHEAVYHVLAAIGWLAIIQRRWTVALLAVGALAAAHPFSGLQQLLILGAWLGILAWRDRTPAAWTRLGVASAMLGIFCAYYFLFLNSFPAHRLLRDSWMSSWLEPMATILLAIGPVAAIAAWRLRRAAWRLSDSDGFLLTAGAVTFLLMKHDWFIAPRQPAHFSRGYNWLPFWLLALPQLQTWGLKLAGLGNRALAVSVLVVAAGFAVSDNVVFLVREWKLGEYDREHLSVTQRSMLQWMDRAGLRGVLLCADPRLSYLSATYSGVRPYYGHLANTPAVQRRWSEVKAWQRRGEVGAWLDTIDYVLIERRDPPAGFDWTRWRELTRNEDFILLGRPGSPPKNESGAR